MTITIVDYGLGNLGSLVNIFKKIGEPAEVISDPVAIGRATKLVLPGVGHFARAMEELDRRRLRAPLDDRAMAARVPVLGICLGMQLLARRSEEGNCHGLGWIDAEVVRFPPAEQTGFKVPNMGWRSLQVTRPEPLFIDVAVDWRFYFVHSYHMVCTDPADVLARARYGIDFTAACGRGNVLGTQFHPEKSHSYGMRLLRRFAALPTGVST